MGPSTCLSRSSSANIFSNVIPALYFQSNPRSSQRRILLEGPGPEMIDQQERKEKGRKRLKMNFNSLLRTTTQFLLNSLADTKQPSRTFPYIAQPFFQVGDLSPSTISVHGESQLLEDVRLHLATTSPS